MSGQRAYEAYRQFQLMAYPSMHLLEWDGLSSVEQTAWLAAASSVAAGIALAISDRLEALKSAIRAFTADPKGPDGKPVPNGPAEEAWLKATNAVLALPSTPETAEVFRLFETYCSADADRLKELRLAAEEFFGGSFQ